MTRAAALAILLGAHALAQSPPLTPAPRILQIFRETVRPGRENAYVKNEIEIAAAMARLDYPSRYLTVSAITGINDIWVLNGFDDYAQVDQTGVEIAKNPSIMESIGRIMDSKDGLVNEGRTIFAHYREDMSQGRGLSGPRPRFFSITVVSVRAGHERDYAEMWRISHAGHQRSGLTDIHSVYQVASGMPDGTFLVFTPAGSLEDAGTSRITHGRRFDEALGATAAARMHELMRSVVLGSETNIFAIHAGMSFPAKEWVDADPDFWKPPKQ
ncbi:MAG TPA: hypothetical protein VGP79_03900 [Bryobacteraceae bacterium]|nr:hypothetical protein [Bryobacteraceae bacterium]